MDLHLKVFDGYLAIHWLNTGQEGRVAKSLAHTLHHVYFSSFLPTSRGTGLFDDSIVADMEKLHIQMLSLSFRPF